MTTGWTDRLAAWPTLWFRAVVAIVFWVLVVPPLLAWLHWTPADGSAKGAWLGALWLWKYLAMISLVCLVVWHKRGRRRQALDQGLGPLLRDSLGGLVEPGESRRKSGLLVLRDDDLRFVPANGGEHVVLSRDDLTAVRESSYLEVDAGGRAWWFAVADRRGWAVAVIAWAREPARQKAPAT